MERPRSIDGERRGRRSLGQRSAPHVINERDKRMADLFNKEVKGQQEADKPAQRDTEEEATE